MTDTNEPITFQNSIADIQQMIEQFQSDSPISKRSVLNHDLNRQPGHMPQQGHGEEAVLKMIEDAFELDFNPQCFMKILHLFH